MGKKQVLGVQLALAFVAEHKEEFEKWVEVRAIKNFTSQLDKIAKDGGFPGQKVQEDI